MSISENSFPKNTLGLQRGSCIRVENLLVQEQLGIKIGTSIPIGYDGNFVRCGPFTWSIEQLEREIIAGNWSIAGHIDLSNLDVSHDFAKEVECIE